MVVFPPSEFSGVLQPASLSDMISVLLAFPHGSAGRLTPGAEWAGGASWTAHPAGQGETLILDVNESHFIQIFDILWQILTCFNDSCILFIFKYHSFNFLHFLMMPIWILVTFTLFNYWSYHFICLFVCI